MKTSLYNLRADHLAGRRGGQYAVCSAHPEVIAAALELSAENGRPLLVEATANQVNQFGGYTGMTPADFAAFIAGIAAALGFPRENLLLGADHLGPYVWRSEPAAKAMARAMELARRCVAAGFAKIHLDTGFGCRDDAGSRLPPEGVAERAALLCRACEEEADRRPPGVARPLYVIGAEVPLPGGAIEDPERIEITRPEEVEHFIRLARMEFRAAGIEAAYERVLAVVVQPGVEFGEAGVARYDPARAGALSAFHAELPGRMTYEVHSTDYQAPEALAALVADHFALLKVGPCLTNAYREAVFTLEAIEEEVLKSRRSTVPSDLSRVMEALMQAHPAHWRSHYRGGAAELRRMRRESRLDRIRCYWALPEARAAIDRLFRNLPPALPAELVLPHAPQAPALFSSTDEALSPASLVRRWIRAALAPYAAACR
jgi:D-tagatose-1,6-bisphosphate aldolase subunit GatZ/KbaZ